jgi:hypothetical protein
MTLAVPTRGSETDRECPVCGSSEPTQRRGEVIRRESGLVVGEVYLCDPSEGCGHRWEVDTREEAIYRHGGEE